MHFSCTFAVRFKTDSSSDNIGYQIFLLINSEKNWLNR